MHGNSHSSMIKQAQMMFYALMVLSTPMTHLTGLVKLVKTTNGYGTILVFAKFTPMLTQLSMLHWVTETTGGSLKNTNGQA